MEISEAEFRSVIESGEGKSSLSNVLSTLTGQYNMDRNTARIMVLRATNQEYTDGQTLLEYDPSTDLDEFTETSQGPDLSQSGSNSQDEPEQSYSGDVVEWDGESEVFDESEVDDETPSATDEEFYHLPIRESSDHPFIPEQRNYMFSEKAEGVTDVEEFTFAMANNDFGCLITGEPGTGKGHMVKYVAAETNTPLIRVNMGVGITKKKLVGGYVPRSNGDGLDEQLEKAQEMSDSHEISVGRALETLNIREKFVWKDGWFTKAFKNGWWILLDEINAADAETLMPFFGALEDAGSRSLELMERSQTITPHPGFRLVATRNPIHHAGTKQMNHALLDRMFELESDYLPEKSEVKLLQNLAPLDEDDARKAVKLAQSIRAAYPEEVSRTLTPRGLQRIGEWTEIYSFEQAARMELLKGVDYEDEADAIERHLENVVNS